MPISIDDLTPAQRRELGLRKPRQIKFSADQVRTHALKVLAEIAHLTQDQRRRVLDHCLKVNRV